MVMNVKKTEPKPQKDVDFLIDNIDRQNALCIVILNGSGRTILLKGAFGHTWKNTGHGINSIFRLKDTKNKHKLILFPKRNFYSF